MFDLAKNPWYYVAHYRYPIATGYTVGQLEVCTQRRIADTTSFTDLMDELKKVAASHRPMPTGAVILTGLTLLGGPDDRADSAEDVKTRAITTQAYEVAQAWAALPGNQRSLIGGQLGHDALANALDDLTDMVA